MLNAGRQDKETDDKTGESAVPEGGLPSKDWLSALEVKVSFSFSWVLPEKESDHHRARFPSFIRTGRTNDFASPRFAVRLVDLDL